MLEEHRNIITDCFSDSGRTEIFKGGDYFMGTHIV